MTYGELADACRKAADVEKAGLANIYAAFQAPKQPDRAGQELVVKTVLAACLRREFPLLSARARQPGILCENLAAAEEMNSYPMNRAKSHDGFPF